MQQGNGQYNVGGVLLPRPFTAVFVCMKRGSLIGVPRAACCPCEAVALADQPPVAPFQLE